VYQFFLNGGSDAYVVGLKASYQLSGGPHAGYRACNADASHCRRRIIFTAKEPTDGAATVLTININNVRSSSLTGIPLDLADYTITYGTRVETYRGVQLGAADFNKINKASSLVAIAPSGGNYGTAYAGAVIPPVMLTTTLPATLVTTLSALDFTSVFQAISHWTRFKFSTC